MVLAIGWMLGDVLFYGLHLSSPIVAGALGGGIAAMLMLIVNSASVRR